MIATLGGTRSEADIIRWFSPTGTGTGIASTNPMALNYFNFTNQLCTPGETNFTFKLLPSATAYPIDRVLVIPNEMAVGVLTNLNLTIEGIGSTPESVRLVNIAPKGSYSFPDHILKLDLSYNEALNPSNRIFRMAARVVIQNLLLDGNWQSKMDQYQAPAYAQGYKNAPLLVTASSGAIRKVIIRNFGAVGYVPWSHFGGAPGVETFPLVVSGDDVGQVPPPGQRRPWEIVDCEVHGFYGEYAGYVTEVMVGPNYSNTTHGYSPEWARTDPHRRFAVVRNVQYRFESDGGSIIAMGNAAYPNGEYDSGRTTFTDSVVLNTSLGYNVDTGKVVGVDLQNNLGLGIWWWANLNSVASGWNDHFNINHNSVRFGPRANYPTFRVFCWESFADQANQYTDPTLVLGRQVTNDVFTLVRVGSVNNLTISNNQMTTIPASRFDETGMVGLTNRWRLLEKFASRLDASCEENPVIYWPSLNLRLGTNFTSSYAQDFRMRVPISAGGFEGNATTASFPTEQALRPVLSDMYLTPAYNFGRICRVIPQTSPTTRTYRWKTGPSSESTVNFTDAVLTGALEVSMGQPEVGTQWVKVPARLVEQKMRGFESVPIDNAGIWLTVSGLTNWSSYQVAAGYDLNEFTVPVNTATHGELIITAFHDPSGTNLASGQFSEYRVAYARGTLPIGTVVSVRPVISVAQDRREGGVQEGRIRFERTGSLATNLTVNVSLGEVAGRRPATLGTDYTLVVSGPGSISAAGTNATVSFPTNVVAVEVRVIPVADQIIEQEHAWFTVMPGSRYAVSGSRSKASVYIYDGPRWTLYELTHSISCPGEPVLARLGIKSAKRSATKDEPQMELMDSSPPPPPVVRAVGVNGVLTAQGHPAPVIAANAWMTCATGDPEQGLTNASSEIGASWNLPGSGGIGYQSFVFDPPNPPYSPVVTGISDQTAAVYPGYVRLYTGLDRAIKAWVGGSAGYLNSWSYLPIPTGGAWLTSKNRALCVSPNGTYIGGYATRIQSSPAVEEQIPVSWSGTTMSPLFTEPALQLGRSGEVRAVNDSGEFVGSRTMANSIGQFIPRAYRSRTNAAVVLLGDFLFPPGQAGVIELDVPSQAITINQRSGILSGVAAGWAGFWNGTSYRKLPAIWWNRTNGAPEPTNSSWVPIPFGVNQGQINTIDSYGRLYGWISSDQGTNRIAWMWANGWTGGNRMDDKSLTYGSSGEWELQEFIDATDAEVILGTGRKDGIPRSFVLVPQPNAGY